MLLFLVLLLPHDRVVMDRVDGVEVNSVFSETGDLVFDQVIWFRWNRWQDRFDIVDWRLLKGVRDEFTEQEKQARLRNDFPPPIPCWRGGHATPRETKQGFVAEWWDEKDRCQRRVVALWYRRTMSIGDPEVRQREILSEAKRTRLRR